MRAYFVIFTLLLAGTTANALTCDQLCERLENKVLKDGEAVLALANQNLQTHNVKTAYVQVSYNSVSDGYQMATKMSGRQLPKEVAMKLGAICPAFQLSPKHQVMLLDLAGLAYAVKSLPTGQEPFQCR